MYNLYCFYESGLRFKEGITSSYALCEIATKAVLISTLKIISSSTKLYKVPNISHSFILHTVLRDLRKQSYQSLSPLNITHPVCRF